MTHDEYYAYTELGKNKLEHFGILGMHWGVRRYQNPDGTLTSAGKKRQQTIDAAKSKAQRHAELAREDSERFSKEYENLKNKKKMSDEDRKKWVEDTYGSSEYVDEKFLQEEADQNGYKSINDMMDSDFERYTQDKKDFSEIAGKYAKKCDEIVQKYSDVKVSELSKQDIKDAKSIVRSAYYLGGMINPNSTIHIDDYKKYLDKYGYDVM